MEYLDHDYLIVCPQCLPTAQAAHPDAPQDYLVELTTKGADRCEWPDHRTVEQTMDALRALCHPFYDGVDPLADREEGL